MRYSFINPVPEKLVQMRYDLHIHSKYSSDGVLEPARIVEMAMKAGLKGIAVTDHNTIRGGLEAKHYETEDFKVIVGSEIRTEKGEITGLFLSQEIKPGDAERVISEIKNQGGIVIIPHPFDEMRHSAFCPAEGDARFIDAIEVYNSRCVIQKYNEKAMEFARKHSLPIVAGSDAHFANEIGKAGVITEAEDVREAIIRNDIKIFGKRTWLINHVRTKALKIWRRWAEPVNEKKGE
jgi:predicted metal-dependent phosphoesterase TrpH